MTLAVSIAQGGSNNVTMRNRIINGAMMIDQRNAGASTLITANGQFSVDRWAIQSNPASKVTIQQNSGGVTPPAGFSNYLGVSVTTNFTPSSVQYCGIAQSIEANNMLDFNWGTANAKAATISFWVRSSLTGTFGGALQGYVANMCFPFSYTINSANTWEYKTVSVPAPLTGTFGTGNTGYITLNFSLGTGSTYQNAAGAWINSNSLSCTGETQLVATSGATFYITGVQLEAGTTATPFEQRLYGTELALCQRYYIKFGGNNAYEQFAVGMTYISTLSYGLVHFPVEMRSAPTLTYSTIRWADEGASYPASSAVMDVAGTKASSVQIVSTGMTAYRPGFITANNSTSGFVAFSAEL